MRAQLADPDGKARKWRSSDCMALPAGCGMAREAVEKKKKQEGKKEMQTLQALRVCHSASGDKRS